MKTSILLVSLLAAATAHADGITLSGSDGAATLTLHGIHAIAPAVRSVGDRIEIDVADESPAQLVNFTDPTIKKVEVIGGTHARVVIQIKHSTKTTEILGRAAKVEDKDDELTIRIPRDAKAAAEMAAEPAPVAAAAPPPPPIPAPAPVAAAPVIVPVPTPAPAPAPAPIAIAPAPTTPSLVLADSPRLPAGTLLALAGVGAAAFLIHLGRKKRGKAPEQPKRTIDVLASRGLGGKTRIMLISVDDNELLLSVSDQGARVLLSWTKEDDKDDWRTATGGPAGLRTAVGETQDDWRSLTATPQPVGIAPPRSLPQPSAQAARGTVDLGSARAPSPAVQGILKLKLGAGSAPHPSAPEEDDGDPNRDAAWVKELVKAARRGGHAS